VAPLIASNLSASNTSRRAEASFVSGRARCAAWRPGSSAYLPGSSDRWP